MNLTILFFFLLHALSIYSTEFRSLWLDSPRSSWPQLKSDLECDVVIVGGGISGVATLYYLLTSTDKKVALLEKSSIASGATGHNAGLAVASIEKSFSEIVEEFGYEPAKQLFEEIASSTELLYTISAKVGFENELVPLDESCFGHSSISTLIDWLDEYSNNTCWVLEKEEIKREIPLDFHNQIRWVSREEISNILKIDDPTCIGVTFARNKRIRINSALFCNQVLRYLAKTFPDRCLIYEHSEISQIDLSLNHQCSHHVFGKVFSKDLILCTNAYTNFSIFDLRTGKVLSKLKEKMIQREGYIAAYPIEEHHHSSLIGFIPEGSIHSIVPYWYTSVAPLSPNTKDYMVCLGGPEYTLDFPATFEQIEEQANESLQLMRNFVSNPPSSFPYFWHGTMAYTENGMRWVGEDPNHPHLWYNLGCNGIGILPALLGGQKIAKQMAGETFKPSLFDPPNDENKISQP